MDTEIDSRYGKCFNLPDYYKNMRYSNDREEYFKIISS